MISYWNPTVRKIIIRSCLLVIIHISLAFWRVNPGVVQFRKIDFSSIFECNIGIYDLHFPIFLMGYVNRPINSAAGHSNATFNSVSQTYGIVMPTLPIPKHSHCVCLEIIESWSDLGEFIIMHHIYDIMGNYISKELRSEVGSNFWSTNNKILILPNEAELLRDLVHDCRSVYLHGSYSIVLKSTCFNMPRPRRNDCHFAYNIVVVLLCCFFVVVFFFNTSSFSV